MLPNPSILPELLDNTGIRYTVSHTAGYVYRKYLVPTAASIRRIGIH